MIEYLSACRLEESQRAGESRVLKANDPAEKAIATGSSELSQETFGVCLLSELITLVLM